MIRVRYLIFLVPLIWGFALFAQPYPHPMAKGSAGMIVTCEPKAADIGLSVLRKGGSAADAFVATVLSEYVLASGYTSLSGPLNLLYFDASTQKTVYLNAGNNKVKDPAGQFESKNPIAGKSYVVGGAGRGLEALFKRFGSGKLTFKELVTPAANLARNGFTIDKYYQYALADRAPLFTRADVWNQVYRKDGKLLVAGDLLKQPALADTLDHFGAEGADYLFKGKYAQDLVATIQSFGGKLTLDDLSSYQVNWADPLEINYRGYTVQSSSYRSEGGLQLLLGLKALENYSDLGKGPHFSKDEAVFDKVLRTYLFSIVASNPAWKYANRLDNLSDQQAALAGKNSKIMSPSQIWAKASDPTIPFPWTKPVSGNHSCDTIIIDKAGNLIAGNDTINSYQWGDYGMMNDGVSLNTSYSTQSDSPPGERTIDGLGPVIILKDGKPWAGAGFFDGSLAAAAFEVLVNLMDYDMTPNDAIFSPRFGALTGADPLKFPIDPRIPSSWIADYSKKGVSLLPPMKNGQINPKGYVDTGDAMVIRVDPKTGTRYGSPTEVLPDTIAVAE